MPGSIRWKKCLTELEERPVDAELVANIFRSVHTIKGTTGFLGYARLESLSHAGENLLGMLRDGKLVVNAEIISALLDLLDGLRSILKSIEMDGDEGQGSDETMIVRLLVLAQATATQGPRSSAKTPFAPGDPSRHELSPVGEAPPAASTQPNAADSTLRVDITLLNRMMNLVGELVLTRNQILQANSTDAEFTPLARRLDMVTADLREAEMKARMQPVSHVFSKFPRLVRDLTQQLDKRMRLRMEGQETELDKACRSRAMQAKALPH